jgi:hypothetical protein
MNWQRQGLLGKGRREEKPGKRGVGKRGGYSMFVTAAVFHSEMSPLNKDRTGG